MKSQFELPSPEAFFKNANALSNNFRDSARLYRPPELILMCESIEESSKKYKGKRNEHLQVFTQLIHAINNDPVFTCPKKGLGEGKLEQNEHARHALGGALLHRAWKIKHPEFISRDNATNLFKNALSLVMTVDMDCELEKNVIFKALNITSLQDIDALTMVTWCTSLHDYMKEKARYKDYPHYAQDVGFFNFLQSTIAIHKRDADNILTQINLLIFLKSITDSVQVIRSGLLTLLTHIKTNIKNFEAPIEMNFLKELFNNVHIPKPMAGRFLYLTEGMESSQKKSWNIFEERMTLWIDIQCSYTLYGAYYVLYQQSQNQNFRFTLLKALNFNNENNMDETETLDAVNTLLDFYLAFDDLEKRVSWHLYQPRGIVGNFKQDCMEAVKLLMRVQPEKPVSILFSP